MVFDFQVFLQVDHSKVGFSPMNFLVGNYDHPKVGTIILI